MMIAVAIALHTLGAVVWVGGMFVIYVCLRPALSTLEPSQRMQLMRVTFQNFFPWVWAAILALLLAGYWMVFTTFGGFAGAGLYIDIMQTIGWIMIALFVWLFHGPWLAFRRAVDAEDWPGASAHLQPHPSDHRRESPAGPRSRRHWCKRSLLGLATGIFAGSLTRMHARYCLKCL